MGKQWQKTALVTILSVLLMGIAISGCTPAPSSPSSAPPTLTPVPSSTTTQTTKTHIYIDGKIIVRGSGEPVELINNPDATNPTFAELVAFLERDHTYEYPYIVGPPKNAFICSDFAETVHNNAEVAGIRAAWVGIDIEGITEGHAINAFETTDLGLIYIDYTGKGLWDESRNRSSLDRRAYVEVGKPYSLTNMNSGLSVFWFYISSCPVGGYLRVSNPSIWELFSADTVQERELQSEKRLEWHRTHDIIALGQKWIQEWLQKHELELSQGGRVSEPQEGSGGTLWWGGEGYRFDQEWMVSMLDSNEVPWFQPEQVLAKWWIEPDLYWEGFMEDEFIPADAKVEQKIIEVDGLPIAWEIGWKDIVRNQFKPFGDKVVKDIHIYWGE